LRQFFLPFAKLFASKSRIISQAFPTWYHSRKSIFNLLPNELIIENSYGHNHTFFPFSRMFPKLSIRLAGVIGRKKESKFKKWLSGDVLLILKKEFRND
jgi:hypothetical protein